MTTIAWKAFAFVPGIYWVTISVLFGGQRGMQEADALLVLVSRVPK